MIRMQVACIRDFPRISNDDQSKWSHVVSAFCIDIAWFDLTADH